MVAPNTRTGHEIPEGRGLEVKLYSFFNLALDWVGGQHHTPAAFPPGKDLVPILQYLNSLSYYTVVDSAS